MEKLINTFGKDWWKKVLFVLTFASIVENYCPSRCMTRKNILKDKRKYFEGQVKYGMIH